MSALWRWLILRRLVSEPGRTLLVVSGVALGVGVVVAVRLASHSALASFSGTVDAVTGRANLCVTAVADGFDERLFARIRREPGVEAAAPVIEVDALAPGAGVLARAGAQSGERSEESDLGETVLVLGLDPFSEPPFARLAPAPGGQAFDARAAMTLLGRPGSVAITRSLAARRGLQVGDTLRVLASGAPVPLTVAAVLGGEALQQAMGGNVVVADIATVQELFGRVGRLDRVDLIVAPGSGDRVRSALAAWLPADARPEPPRARTRQVEDMVSAFALNLAALSFIALFVGVFLVFNAVALSVVRQRRDIGALRSLGLTRRRLVALFVAEGLAFGGVGGLLGCALGVGLARLALHQVAHTLTALYLVEQVSRVHVAPSILLSGLALGVVSALASALGPALEASTTPPGVTLREGARIEERHPPYARLALAGFASLALAAAVAAWTAWARAAAGGFVAAFFVVVGFSLLAPAWTLAVERLASRGARPLGVIATLGARALRENAARASVVVAALMVAAGMLVALTVMVRSFRRTVDTWVTQTLRGDLYVEPVGHRASQRATVLPESLVDGARGIPGVEAVDTYRGSWITLDGRLAQAVGIELEVQRRFGRLQFVGGEDARSVLARALAEPGVLVTESFAHRHRVRAGDSIVLPTPAGGFRASVEGVFFDYSTDAGAVVMDRALYARLWRDDRTESMALYLRPGASVEDVRRRFLALAGPDRLLHVTPNAELRRRVLAVFDETFRITWALQAIAVLVSVLGVVSTLTTLVLQRRHELAVLRAVGARRSQVRALVVVESALLGAAGAALGAIAGLVLALLLVHVINRQFFGWTIRMTLEPGVFVRTLLLMTATATLAGLLPARIAAQHATVGALRTE